MTHMSPSRVCTMMNNREADQKIRIPAPSAHLDRLPVRFRKVRPVCNAVLDGRHHRVFTPPMTRQDKESGNRGGGRTGETDTGLMYSKEKSENHAHERVRGSVRVTRVERKGDSH